MRHRVHQLFRIAHALRPAPAFAATATEARLYIDRPAVERARTVRIIPTSFPAEVEGSGPLTAADRRLIANAADRALCYDLSLRYDIVTSRDADLTVRPR